VITFILARTALTRINIDFTALARCSQRAIANEVAGHKVFHAHAAAARPAVTGLDADLTPAARVHGGT